MRSWDSLTIAEQTLMRSALSDYPLTGVVQDYGAALRWAGAEGAPAPRSYTDDEQRAVVPGLAAAALDLAERGLLAVREGERYRPAVPRPVTGPQLRRVLAEPANWLWSTRPERHLFLSAPEPAREHWSGDAYPVADPAGLPTWGELSVEEREVLLCAGDAGAMLTGAFGLWEDPPDELDAARRRAWVERQIAPLLRFVRDGWIEVRHHPDGDSDTFSVIGVDSLGTALADPAVRYEGDRWGIGVGCVFTHTGLAVRRAAQRHHGWGAPPEPDHR
ncbi:hypothetical protein [Streptomyces sp. NPDC021020]|uniref:hypothetical protein n=1 Tax=Streptomyces sp. NPDC021020 TaxID=3365109 RepID=UPI0037A58AE4